MFHQKALLPARLGIPFVVSTIVGCHSIVVTIQRACCFAVRSVGCSIVLPTCSPCRWQFSRNSTYSLSPILIGRHTSGTHTYNTIHSVFYPEMATIG